MIIPKSYFRPFPNPRCICWNDLWFPSEVDFDVRIGKAHDHGDHRIHSHDDFLELVVVTGGKATSILDSKSYRVGKGSAFMINPNQSHGYENAENLDLFNVCIKESALKQQPLKLLMAPGYVAFFRVEPMFRATRAVESQLTLSDESLEEASWLLEKLKTVLADSNPLSGVRSKALFTELLAMLTIEYQSISSARFNAGSLQFAKAISFIETNYADQITVIDVAKHAGLSVRTLHRSCVAYAGTSPKRLIIDYRIEKAKQFLEDDKRSITEVGFATGFADSNHFSNCFKMKVGTSPKQFRKRLRIIGDPR